MRTWHAPDHLHYLSTCVPALQLLAAGPLAPLLGCSCWSALFERATAVGGSSAVSCTAVILRCSCWSAPGATAVGGSPALNCMGRQPSSLEMLRTGCPQRLGKAATQVGRGLLLGVRFTECDHPLGTKTAAGTEPFGHQVTVRQAAHGSAAKHTPLSHSCLLQERGRVAAG